MRLKGRTAIVTGAAQGLGLAIAKAFAAEGANIVAADLNDAPIAELGAQAIGVRADVSKEADVAAMAQAALARFGAIDILVNNAAIFSGLKLQPFEDIAAEEWRRLFDVNVLGAFLCARAVAPHMRAKKWGRIINLASGAAFKGTPYFLHYVTSKGAILTMTRGLAQELGPDNVLVNAIAPGFTLSDGVLSNSEFMAKHRAGAASGRALQRDAHPEDIVGAAVFLASEDAKFVTGQILAVDGGSVYH